MATQTLMTAEQFDQLPEEEGRRWELLDGELIEVASPIPEHNDTALKLILSLGSFLTQHKIAWLLYETEFAIAPERRLKPDIAVLSMEAWSHLDRKRIPVIEIPLIAIEVVSPSNNAYLLQKKRHAYLDAGVAEVWVIYPEEKEIFVHRKGQVHLYGPGSTLASELLPGWSLITGDLFLS